MPDQATAAKTIGGETIRATAPPVLVALPYLARSIWMASCSSAAKQKQERARKETTGIPHSQVDARTLTLFETPPAPRAFRNKMPDVRVTFDYQGSAPVVHRNQITDIGKDVYEREHIVRSGLPRNMTVPMRHEYFKFSSYFRWMALPSLRRYGVAQWPACGCASPSGEPLAIAAFAW
jgi:hypothetical protein